MRATIAKITESLWRRRHWGIGAVSVWLSQVMNGWFGFHAVPGNVRRLQRFRDEIIKAWLRVPQAKVSTSSLAVVTNAADGPQQATQSQDPSSLPGTTFSRPTQGRSRMR